jgi:two-component system, chemotaxis family, response regulator Rcp1
MTTAPYHILLVEDNSDDVWLIKRACAEGDLPCEIHAVEDGVEATHFLQRRGHYANAPMPDLILLDLKLPRKDGGQVLTEVKADERLKHIPVIILTGSDSEEDILRSYANYANSYVQKPNLGPFSKKIRSVVDYWLTTARIPYHDHQDQREAERPPARSADGKQA